MGGGGAGARGSERVGRKLGASLSSLRRLSYSLRLRAIELTMPVRLLNVNVVVLWSFSGDAAGLPPRGRLPTNLLLQDSVARRALTDTVASVPGRRGCPSPRIRVGRLVEQCGQRPVDLACGRMCSRVRSPVVCTYTVPLEPWLNSEYGE